MNPIKAHLLDRLRPMVQPMTTTISDEEAFALGSRAANAGLRLVPGMKTLHTRAKWSGGIVTGFIRDGAPAVSMGVEAALTPSNLPPDLRDPGTKGHAVAQLRERTGDPFLAACARKTQCTVGAPPGWSVESEGTDLTEWTANGGMPTEEEAIVAAFEAAKETP